MNVEGKLIPKDARISNQFVYRVQWDNGRSNSYREGDLVLVEAPKPKGISAFIKRVEEEYTR
jgi:hypothetical protein